MNKQHVHTAMTALVKKSHVLVYLIQQWFRHTLHTQQAEDICAMLEFGCCTARAIIYFVASEFYACLCVHTGCIWACHLESIGFGIIAAFLWWYWRNLSHAYVATENPSTKVMIVLCCPMRAKSC